MTCLGQRSNLLLHALVVAGLERAHIDHHVDFQGAQLSACPVSNILTELVVAPSGNPATVQTLTGVPCSSRRAQRDPGGIHADAGEPVLTSFGAEAAHVALGGLGLEQGMIDEARDVGRDLGGAQAGTQARGARQPKHAATSQGSSRRSVRRTQGRPSRRFRARAARRLPDRPGGRGSRAPRPRSAPREFWHPPSRVAAAASRQRPDLCAAILPAFAERSDAARWPMILSTRCWCRPPANLVSSQTAATSRAVRRESGANQASARWHHCARGCCAPWRDHSKARRGRPRPCWRPWPSRSRRRPPRCRAMLCRQPPLRRRRAQSRGNRRGRAELSAEILNRVAGIRQKVLEVLLQVVTGMVARQRHHARHVASRADRPARLILLRTIVTPSSAASSRARSVTIAPRGTRSSPRAA